MYKKTKRSGPFFSRLSTIHEILRKYWGYDSFRPLQEEIIRSVLAGNDTLALLPTGGGKSVCYQIPALDREGICIVVSPLISLIKDQLESLRSRGIIAVSIHSGLHKREIDIALDYCIYGKPKFLFLSPERLETELFKVRVQKMKVSLLAIDEAHCISQWGYDFRPSYLRIAEVRKLLPNVPVLALTATATTKVADDIKNRLDFKPGAQTFFQSFERTNLVYVCRNTDNKIEELKNICNKIKGTGIVYVRNRRRTAELAAELQKSGVSAGFYHAGLTTQEREKTQAAWKKDQTRLIVATNAFGMGIDKADVRFVIHYDLPDSPEAYYQEAGRAGRDGKISYAIVLYNQSDLEDLSYFHQLGFPNKEIIRKTYIALGNFYRLAVGSGLSESFAFDMVKFCQTYSFKPIEVLGALKILELDGYLELSDAVFSPSRMKFEVNNLELYNFQIKNHSFDTIVKFLLRKYGGLFDEFVRVKEGEIATALGMSVNEVKNKLRDLEKFGIIKYIEQTDLPFVTWTRARVAERDFTISKSSYETRKENAEKRIDAVKSYVQNHDTCRSTLLLAYFDEKAKQRCGKCDNCIAINKLELNNFDFDRLVAYVSDVLKQGPITLQELLKKTEMADQQKLSKVVEWMIENQRLSIDGNVLKGK